MIDLNDMAREAYEVALARMDNGANINVSTVPMLKHCATEVCEAMEAYGRKDTFFNSTMKLHPDYELQFIHELADIITCVLIIAADNDIDIEQALKEVQENNTARAEGRGDKK